MPHAPTPPHAVQDEEKLVRLTEDMRRRGWVGRPIIVDGDQALEGSHRLAAAELLDLEVPTVDWRDVPGVDWSGAWVPGNGVCYRCGDTLRTIPCPSCSAEQWRAWDYSAVQDITEDLDRRLRGEAA